ncbi:type 2 periplasmic-binding domain-containing protein [Variovorax sp. PvP013]|uniref:hypothetical protein n=1 Tax=Variovorax sp. PvP013 TaxID=3156435 RepID=UPI003D2143B7
MRVWPITALDGAGIPWRQACCRDGRATFDTSVRDGLEVGVFKARGISGRLRILGLADGFPLLPRAEVWIAKADGAAPHATRLLHDFLVMKIRSRATTRAETDMKVP